MALYLEDNNGEKHLIRFINYYGRIYNVYDGPNGNVVIREDEHQN